ncbi:MAG: hypothetical protein ACYDG6_06505 [Thermincolia bacterium]
MGWGVKEVRNYLKASGDITEGDVALTYEASMVLSNACLGMVKVFVVSLDLKHKADEAMHKVKGLTGVHNAITIALH